MEAGRVAEKMARAAKQTATSARQRAGAAFQEMLTKYEESRPIEARARRAYNMIIAANQMQDQGKLAEAGAK